MSDPQTQAAIDAALKNDWQKAMEINSQILEDNPNDTDCMNRLGKAYLELGNNKKAASIFRTVLKLNKYDPIASKNLLRANQPPTASGKRSKNGHSDTPPSSANLSFLEEPGRTKMVALVNIAPTKTLFSLRCADPIILVPKRHTILLEDRFGTYLGALPDDLGHRLLVLIKGGNLYEAFVKSVGKSSLVAFIREKSRSKRFKTTPSFPTGNSDYLSFVREEGPAEEGAAPTEAVSEDDDGGGITKSEHLHQDEVTEEE